jgi:hypothetical protein
MPRKNQNARYIREHHVYLDFRGFAHAVGMTPLQRVKTIKYLRQYFVPINDRKAG